MASRTSKSSPKANRGTRSSPKPSKAKRGKPAGTPSLAREIWLVSCGIVGILAGLVFFGLCAGFWYGSGEIVKIIAEINERDFSVMSQREERYEEFFNQRDGQGYRITKEDKKIFNGVVTYMWRVRPPGSSEIREFGWSHDLETNTVGQTTNGALLLDLKFGLISEEEARTRKTDGNKERFNPDDSIASGIVNGNLSQISQGSLTSGWDDSNPTGNEVMPPLISHDAANNRKAEQLKEMAPEDEFAGEEEPVEQSEDVVDITPVGEG